eukprot:TRINITY_DN865_c0_g1_i1.p1 TRINITY_DN865_c0_g1~~TRINITY_DN865_c0_g1_i1.p1  ORF type:complete len:430 (+),score=101.12 TRINITY_DN865_c0_g1_i1:117-1406(+)
MAMLFAILAAGFFRNTRAALCQPADSCPKLSDGLYCPVNDVTEHGDINRDVKEIKTWLAKDPPDYAKAKEVYTNGNHSSKGGGKMRTLQALAQKDMTVGGKYTNVFYSGALDLYGTIDAIWHNAMMDCFDKVGTCAGKSDDFRTYIINKGAIGIVTAYVTYETGAAVWKAADGSTTDSGAPYAWDEAAAFYVGNVEPLSGDGVTGKAPGNLYSPYEFNWKRDSDFPQGTQTHVAAIPILNSGLINLRGSDYNANNVAAAETAMYKIFSIAAIRSAIKYSWKAYNNGNFQEKYLAEGWAYWRSASGYISTVNKTAVQDVDALFDWSLTSMPADTPCKVKKLVESTYKGLGLTCEMVGEWKDASGCLAEACDDSSSTGSLISGSAAYVDMCKAPETSTSSKSSESSESSSTSRALASFLAMFTAAAIYSLL